MGGCGGCRDAGNGVTEALVTRHIVHHRLDDVVGQEDGIGTQHVTVG